MFQTYKKKFSSNIVRVSFEELVNQGKSQQNISKLLPKIEEAYGINGLGLLVVKDVPDYYKTKSALFRESLKIMNLPKKSLDKIECAPNSYSIGWAHGKENLNGDMPDLLKATFGVELPSVNSKKPGNLSKDPDNNLWPQELPLIKEHLYGLGNLMRNTGLMMLDTVDAYIKTVYSTYNLNQRELIEDSPSNVARVLFYLPKKAQTGYQSIENWCEWHNDHGSFTCLASASYFDENGNEAKDLNLSKTGLYVQNRKGEVIKVALEKDEMALQIGECLQIQSGGCVHATPHAVKVFEDIPDNLRRVNFVFFLNMREELKLTFPEGAKASNILTSDIYKLPKLQDRFKDGMTYGEFANTTMEYFSNPNKRKD